MSLSIFASSVSMRPLSRHRIAPRLPRTTTNGAVSVQPMSSGDIGYGAWVKSTVGVVVAQFENACLSHPGPAPRTRHMPCRKIPLCEKGEAQGDLWGEGGAGFPSSEGWPKAGVGFGIGQMGQPTPLLRRTPPRRGNKAPQTSHPYHRLLTSAAGLLNTSKSLPETRNQGVSCEKITFRHATNIDSKRTKLLESPPCSTSR